MCVGDWRLGRQIRVKVTAVSQTTGTQADFPQDRQRVGITIGMTVAQTSALVSARVAVDDIPLCVLTHESPLRHFTLAEHGELPTRKISFQSFAGTMIGAVIEYFLPEEVIAAGFDEFKRSIPSLR